MNDGHHAAFVYTTLQDPTPLMHYGTDPQKITTRLLFPLERSLYFHTGPPLVTETKGFKQTHAEFHSMVSAKDLGTYAFCGVCGARLKHEMGMREGVVEKLETHQIGMEPVTTKLEDDDKLVRWLTRGGGVGSLADELGAAFRWIPSRRSLGGRRVSAKRGKNGRDGLIGLEKGYCFCSGANKMSGV